MTFLPLAQRPRNCRGRLAGGTSEALDWIRQLLTDPGTDDGCRDWPGSKNPKGYGQLGYEGRTRLVAHVVLELSGRPRPRGAHSLHSCDRPSCAAPWHLRWGTNAENRAESVRKGRTSRGEHRPLAKLTEAAVREIRSSNALLTELAAKFGVGMSTVQKARVGTTWRHVQ